VGVVRFGGVKFDNHAAMYMASESRKKRREKRTKRGRGGGSYHLSQPGEGRKRTTGLGQLAFQGKAIGESIGGVVSLGGEVAKHIGWGEKRSTIPQRLGGGLRREGLGRLGS